MAEIELDPELIAYQQAADDAHAAVRRLQEEYGRPTQDGGWTDDQHATWQAAWIAWRESAALMARCRSSYDSEQALKRAVRHPELVEA
ncbi:hypothetical protein OG730_35110 [Streptomyces sp. NBC_01298]|uniref:hypothetical protein n=1 Tax=Streptomyces sp. NBC_01298 TaxID=2903817 RepID=UPI002E165992|nr:hypothetical protein OG730_35110 [Streptomyces sp. NBC_01298]